MRDGRKFGWRRLRLHHLMATRKFPLSKFTMPTWSLMKEPRNGVLLWQRGWQRRRFDFTCSLCKGRQVRTSVAWMMISSRARKQRPALPDKMMRQIQHLEGQLRNLRKGQSKSKGKGKNKGGRFTSAVKMPQELSGQTATTSSGEPLRFSFNCGGCQSPCACALSGDANNPTPNVTMGSGPQRVTKRRGVRMLCGMPHL